MKLQIALLSLLLTAGAGALAQTPPSPPPPAPLVPGTPMPRASFEQHKAALIAKVQARITREQSLVSCLQGAQNRSDVKACRLAARPVH